MAVKQGGDDPIANTALRDILAEAKNASIPKDLIERNIAKAASSDQSDYSEVTYEAYGPAGAGIIIEVRPYLFPPSRQYVGSCVLLPLST